MAHPDLTYGQQQGQAARTESGNGASTSAGAGYGNGASTSAGAGNGAAGDAVLMVNIAVQTDNEVTTTKATQTSIGQQSMLAVQQQMPHSIGQQKPQPHVEEMQQQPQPSVQQMQQQPQPAVQQMQQQPQSIGQQQPLPAVQQMQQQPQSIGQQQPQPAVQQMQQQPQSIGQQQSQPSVEQMPQQPQPSGQKLYEDLKCIQQFFNRILLEFRKCEAIEHHNHLLVQLNSFTERLNELLETEEPPKIFDEEESTILRKILSNFTRFFIKTKEPLTIFDNVVDENDCIKLEAFLRILKPSLIYYI